MVMMMGLKLRNGEGSFYNHNLADVFSFSTRRDNTSLYIKKNIVDFKIVWFLKASFKSISLSCL